LANKILFKQIVRKNFVRILMADPVYQDLLLIFY